ncbi:MAG: MBL fold metallo-hydrolase [Betaproteobacteria bacterium RIFCSPLOWO2_12_FULL_63_13]|nr:MAG: MBL fold metallo-hydrolase [Betaproteobacteria bacterium RIFCSPLOWO2_12_FULL_63_13]
MAHITDYDDGISAIDAEFIRPNATSIHLIVENGHAAIVDTGSNDAVPIVLDALQRKGLAPEDVDYLVLTHIHLDHAGGAGLLMTKLPNATLTVHPRGTRHISDPRRLIEGTIAVYGEEAARRLYGDIVPVPPDRIMQTRDRARISLNGRELRFIDTPGHARHCVSIVDGRTGHIFAGDTFGLSYRELDVDGRCFIFPTTSPVQFDPPTLHRSIELLERQRPEAIYVTHFSQVRDIPRVAADLHRLLAAHERMALEARAHNLHGEVRRAHLEERLTRLAIEESKRQGWTLSEDGVLAVLNHDIGLNAQGLGDWLDSLG